ncbi:MAG: acyl--CoA ligase, partial [Candidatus Wildermuthbacteria bacterium]|nr:acyl--CoA ligase [Candidatus Wildermuthbacteria bacterium]
MNVAELFIQTFQNNWDELFVTEAVSGKTFSHKDFFRCVLSARQALDNLKIAKGDIVCLIIQNSLHLMVLYFALLLKGAVVVPIDPEKGIEEVDAILSQLQYRCIIADDNIENIGSSHREVIRLNSLAESFYQNDRDADVSLLAVFDDVDYEAPYTITFTSGSTGAPKGVIHSCKNFAMTSQAFAERFNFGPQNVFYHNLPMTYMAGILNLIFLPFFSGSKIVIGDRFRVSGIMRFWEVPARYGVNTFWFIPTIVSLLLKLDRGTDGRTLALRSPMAGCVGTAPLLPRLKKEFEEKYAIPLFESYGLSETLFNTTNAPSDSFADGVGKALRGVELDFGADQEIYVGVPWMFLGYYNINQGDIMREGKFISGDLGQLRGDGSLLITGRKKNIIKRGGANISPESIDSFVDKLNLIESGTAVGIADDILGEKIVFFYVGKPNSEPALE